MADYRIIRLTMSNAASSAITGAEIDDAAIVQKTAAGDLRLAHDPIVYTNIRGMCFDGSGNIYATSWDRNCIVKIEEGGRVSWVAGSQTGAAGNNGTLNNVAAVNARFNAPGGIACDKSGTLYIADTGNQQIRTIRDGKVNVLAGSATLSGFVDGAGETARFNGPIDVAVDKAGIVWVADVSNHALRKVMSNGTVLTVSGRLPAYGGAAAGDENNVQADNHSAQLNAPSSVTVDLQGNVYIGCEGTYTIKKYTADGWLYRFSGSNNAGKSLGVTNLGTIATCPQFTCKYTGIYDLAADASGNVYVLDHDTTRSRLLKLDRMGVPAEVADWDSNSYSNGPYAIAMSPSQVLFVANNS